MTPPPPAPPASQTPVARRPAGTRPPATARGVTSSAQRARQVASAGVPHLTRGAGEHYLPLPNARLVEPPAAGDVRDAVVFAPEGTPVHAVCAGTVGDSDAAALRIEGEDGHTFVYTKVQDRRVARGERVDAGAIVGVIGAVGDRHALRLAVTDRGNAPVRPHDLLLGAVDPNDLGYGPAGTGTDLDPDASTATRVRSTPGPAPRPSVDRTPKRQPPPATSRDGGSPSTSATPAASPSTSARGAAPTPVTPRPAPPRPVTPGFPAPPKAPTPTTAVASEPESGPAPEPEPEPAPEPAPKNKPPTFIPPPPPPVPLIDKQEDQTDEQQSAPTRSDEQQRKRAAMLIASRRRRQDDTGSQR